jgi:hypothetical protein
MYSILTKLGLNAAEKKVTCVNERLKKKSFYRIKHIKCSKYLFRHYKIQVFLTYGNVQYCDVVLTTCIYSVEQLTVYFDLHGVP